MINISGKGKGKQNNHPKAKALGRKGVILPVHKPKQIAVSKSGQISSKAPSLPAIVRGCPCGNLTDKTYFVLFSTGQSYCSECWAKRAPDEKLGFAQSIEQMKKLGALQYKNWHSSADKVNNAPGAKAVNKGGKAKGK